MDDDIEILNQLRNRNIRAFKQVCCDHSENMTALAYAILRDTKKTSEVVDEILFKLWNDTDLSTVTMPFQQFFYAQVLKSCGAAS
jgi:hypothetical protein